MPIELTINWFLPIYVVLFIFTWVLPLTLTNKDKKLTRTAFLLRAAPTIVVGLLLYPFKADADKGLVRSLAGWSILALWALLVFWSARRAQDMDVSKWWCLLLTVPLINLVFFVALVFTRSVGSKSKAPSGPATPTSTDIEDR